MNQKQISADQHLHIHALSLKKDRTHNPKKTQDRRAIEYLKSAHPLPTLRTREQLSWALKPEKGTNDRQFKRHINLNSPESNHIVNTNQPKSHRGQKIDATDWNLYQTSHNKSHCRILASIRIRANKATRRRKNENISTS